MVTDTGDVARAIDRAAARWPDRSRSELARLLIAQAGESLERQERRERQREAARVIPTLIDSEVLLGDEAWR